MLYPTDQQGGAVPHRHSLCVYAYKGVKAPFSGVCGGLGGSKAPFSGVCGGVGGGQGG